MPALAGAGAAGGAAAEGGLAAATEAGTGFDLATLSPGVAAAGTGEFAGVPLAGLDASTIGTGAAAADPYAGLFMSAGGTTIPADAAAATAALPPGIAGISPDLAMSSSIGDLAGLETGTGPSWLGTPFASDAALTGGNFAGAGGAAGGGATGSAPFFGVSDTGETLGAGLGGGAPVNISPIGGVGPGAAAQAAPQGFAANFTQSLSGFPGQVGKMLGNPLTDIGLAGLGYNMYQGYQSQQQLKALQQQETDYQNKIAQAGQASLSAAQPMIMTGESLMMGGPVPAPMQAMLDQYRNSQRAGIIQGYAARNQGADPKTNSALQQDLAAVDNRMLQLRETIGNQILTTANTMLSSGVSATQIAAKLPMMMQQLDMQLQQMSGNAIANFAAAMSGGTMKVAGQGTGGVNLNLNTPGVTTSQSLLGA